MLAIGSHGIMEKTSVLGKRLHGLCNYAVNLRFDLKKRRKKSKSNRFSNQLVIRQQFIERKNVIWDSKKFLETFQNQLQSSAIIEILL